MAAAPDVYDQELQVLRQPRRRADLHALAHGRHRAHVNLASKLVQQVALLLVGVIGTQLLAVSARATAAVARPD